MYGSSACGKVDVLMSRVNVIPSEKSKAGKGLGAGRGVENLV